MAILPRAGSLQFDFNSEAEKRGIPYIADCYTFNAVADAVYTYYYTDFPLIQIENGSASKVCDVPISGARGFAIHGDHALFCGAYNKPTSLFSVDLPSARVEELQPASEGRSLADFGCAAARGPRMYVATQRTLYAADISDLGFPD